MLTATPHPYQDSAIDAAVDRGSLLIAFEMGLGKTLIALAAIEELLGRNEIDMSVIVVPPSLKYQWAQQIAKLTDVDTRVIEVRGEDGEKQSITVPTENYGVIIDGTPAKRQAQYERITADRPDYVIMGYSNVVDDWNMVRRLKPGCIVLDEATAIKTFKAQRTRKIKRLTAPFRLALTGTPVENGKPEEIFSIMQWVDDTVLGRFDLFDSTYIVRNGFGGVTRYKNLPVLHNRLAQAMVRKTALDEDVAPYLPQTIERNVPVTLDAKTKKAYRKIASDLLEELSKATPASGSFDVFTHYHGGGDFDENSQQGQIMARMGALDMLLNHPDLVVRSGQNYEDSQKQRDLGVQKVTWPGSKYAYEIWQSGLLDDVESTPKLDVLIEEVETILASNPGNKIIVFSVNPDMLSLIDDRLPDGIAVQYHGRMSAGVKAAGAARFQQDETCRVFLSSHAGAFGTDLYMANHLINYDLAWSSGKQDQINARHARASSEFKTIFVHNLLTTDTTEPRKYSSLALKRRVGSAITDGRGADDKGRVDNDLVTLSEYLRKSTL
jgi:SNF2 family DNA or RNA helicase